MKKKLLNNLLISLAFSVVIGLAFWADPMINLKLALKIAGVFFLIEMTLASLFGDEEFNITGNWSASANRIKNVIGASVAIPLMIGGFYVMALIASFLFEPHG